MTLYEQILSDLKSAMLNKEKEKTIVLRALKSAIQKKEISERQDGHDSATLSDAEVQQVLQKEAKQRKDSISQFESANRDDLAEKEKFELSVIEEYLPKMMTEEEIASLVDEVFEQVKPEGPQDMGKVMGAVMPKVKGKADGSLVNKVVKEKLN